jgi:hypothetical protein
MRTVFENLIVIFCIIYFSGVAFIFFNDIKKFIKNKKRQAIKEKLEILKSTIEYAEKDNNQDLINACKKQIEIEKYKNIGV